MTRQLITYLTILISVCGQNLQSANTVLVENKKVAIDSLQTFSITNATTDDFNNAKRVYIGKTHFDTTTYKKVNGVIKLPVERMWNPFVIFKDTLQNTDKLDIKEYHYLGQFEKIGFYIVGAGLFEYSECYLIDKKTGIKTTIWNTPSISPNDKFIANLSMEYGLDGIPNGVQIWRVDRHENNQSEPISISKYLELDQQIWVPVDFVWETDRSLIMKVADIDKYMNENGRTNDSDFYFLRLRIK